MPVQFGHLSREELHRQLPPSLAAKDVGAVLARHQAETAALDAAPGLSRWRDVACGPKPRQRYDVAAPGGGGGGGAGAGLPCLVFIHGGFWQEGSRAWSGFAAKAFARAGWARCAVRTGVTARRFSERPLAPICPSAARPPSQTR